MAKAVEELQMPWRRCQGCVGVAKAVGAWPRSWERGLGIGGVAKAVSANPNPNPKTVEA